MGSKLHIQTVNKAQVLILLLILAVISGCPDPNMHIWFESNGKLSKELQLKLLDDKISVKLGSASSLGSEDTEYYLQLVAEVRFPAGLREQLEFNPESVSVFVGKHWMKPDSSRFFGFEDIMTTTKYATGMRFAYDMKIDSSIVGSVYRREGIPLKIIMDGFIKYEGAELTIDTIYAVEKKPFLY
jgi:hypothetical protein